MIVALFTERPDGSLLEIKGQGYERVAVENEQGQFPPAGEDWPHASHVLIAETTEGRPHGIIKGYIVPLPCGGIAVKSGNTVTVDLRSFNAPENQRPLFPNTQSDSPRSGNDMGLYEWPDVVGD